MNDYRRPKEQSRVWRWRRAIGESGLPPTTRQILQVLSEFMSANGDSCFPSIEDIAEKSGRDRKTVRERLALAEEKGWLVIQSAGWSGPQHARKSYVARWPDNVNEEADSGENSDGSASATDGANDPNRWGDTPHPDGATLPAYNTSPLTSPNNSPEKNASAGADAISDKVRLRKQFLRWHRSFPNFDDFSDSEARKWWFKISDEERRECIRLTPAYVKSLGKAKASSPAHYLRDRAWERLSSEEIDAVPEFIEAKSFSPLWMATRFSILLQPPTGNCVLTIFDRKRTDKTEDQIRLEKLAVHGWPAVNGMMEEMRKGKKGKLLRCPVALKPVADGFKPVEPGTELYAAWSRLHERRGWPFFDFTPPFLPFPAVDLGVADRNAAVEAAMNEFDALINKV